MTKAEIVQALYARVGGFSKKESADIVDLVFEMLKETLGKGEKIKISGFGNFVLRDKRQRPGRNPQTGDPIKISERRVLTFKASQILKQALNPRQAGAPGVPLSSPPSPQAGGTSNGSPTRDSAPPSPLASGAPSHPADPGALPASAPHAPAAPVATEGAAPGSTPQTSSKS
jgi:integration host factor subunit alpha